MSDILIIDDCPESTLLAKNSIKNHTVYTASTIAEAKEIISKVKFSLFIIDIDLPDGSGFDLCVDLCNMPLFQDTPKLMFSGNTQISQKVFGFSCGADDYITKPFSQMELQARVNSKLRVSQTTSSENILSYEFDHVFQRVFLNDPQNEKVDLELTPTQFRLLYTLLKKVNNPLSRRELVKAVWNSNGLNIETRGIDSHISHIRKKLGDKGKHIVAVYGQGYAYKEEL